METLLKLTCVVLEDEDHIRKWLVEKLETFSELELIGEAASIDKAFQLISISSVEMHLPYLPGLEIKPFRYLI